MDAVKENQSNPDAPTAWRTQVDEFATRLMIEGDADAAGSALQTLRAQARDFGFAEAAEVADDLLARLSQAPEAAMAYLLQAGVARLRESCSPPAAADTGGGVSIEEDPELIADFLVEAREHLSQIEGQMLTLERDPRCMEVLHAVFRAFHTIKGVAGFLDFTVVQSVAHEVETLLDLARNEKLDVDGSIVDIVLESGDFLLGEMVAIETMLNTGRPLQTGNSNALIARIRSLAHPSAEPAATEPAPPPVASTASEFSLEPDAPAAEQPADNTEPAPIAVQAAPTPAQTAAQPGKSQPAAQREAARSGDAASVRVDTSKLDYLMDMVGEIVIAQSLIRHNPILASTTDTRLLSDLSQLSRVTAEVQRATMSIRMIPVGQLFQRIERVIRDLSRKANKQVVLETHGIETEIDKTVAEELSDPLLHMVRNSVDHGIEPPAERVAAGKSPEARIRLSAHHQGGQIVIRISDDGRGLNSEKIRRKAEERGLISPSAQLNENEVYQLIFEPGFSTAEKITDVSGRGVGMDVVRRNVEKLRGRIETHSVPGHGTTFELKLPLTLAIIDGLIVEVGAEQYIVPLSRVREIFRPRADTLFTVEGREEMVLVRERLMPVVRLHQRLGIAPRHASPAEGLLVIVESDSKRVCMLVDDLLGKQEVVIKSLGAAFENVPGISGCAVLGDGRVGLILDVDGVYRGRRR